MSTLSAQVEVLGTKNKSVTGNNLVIRARAIASEGASRGLTAIVVLVEKLVKLKSMGSPVNPMACTRRC